MLAPGDSLLLHSDGIVEAHDPSGADVRLPPAEGGGGALPRRRRADRPGARRPAGAHRARTRSRRTTSPWSRSPARRARHREPTARAATHQLVEFEVPSAEGNERLALERVSAIVAPLGLSEARLKRLETAVGEATMNAMEHGNQYRDDQRGHRARAHRAGPGPGPDHRPRRRAGGAARPRCRTSRPSSRDSSDRAGGALFLIKNMVDEVHETSRRRSSTRSSS